MSNIQSGHCWRIKIFEPLEIPSLVSGVFITASSIKINLEIYRRAFKFIRQRGGFGGHRAGVRITLVRKLTPNHSDHLTPWKMILLEFSFPVCVCVPLVRVFFSFEWKWIVEAHVVVYVSGRKLHTFLEKFPLARCFLRVRTSLCGPLRNYISICLSGTSLC